MHYIWWMRRILAILKQMHLILKLQAVWGRQHLAWILNASLIWSTFFHVFGLIHLVFSVHLYIFGEFDCGKLCKMLPDYAPRAERHESFKCTELFAENSPNLCKFKQSSTHRKCSTMSHVPKGTEAEQKWIELNQKVTKLANSVPIPWHVSWKEFAQTKW